MTDDVGVVTGDLEIATRLLNAGVFDVRVRYAGAEEWYTVAGSPVSADGRSSLAEELHEHVVEYLTTPRPVWMATRSLRHSEGSSDLEPSRFWIGVSVGGGPPCG